MWHSSIRTAVGNYEIPPNAFHSSTVDEIYMGLKERIPTVSRTTVYNTLRMFSEKNAALMITIDEHRVCYDGNTTPHAHFFCRKCEKIYDLMDIKPSREYCKDIKGFVVEDAQLYYRGVCPNCQKEAEARFVAGEVIN